MPDQMSGSVGEVVDAVGRVTYDFAGHIHAAGIDFDAVQNPGFDQGISWLRPSDGALLANILGEDNGGAGELDLFARLQDGAAARLSLFAQGPNRGPGPTHPAFAQLVCEYDDVGDVAAVVASAGGSRPRLDRVVVNEGGESDFLQLMAADSLRAQLFQTGSVSDAGGWCNLAYPSAFAFEPFVVLAQTDADSGSFGHPALVVERQGVSNFRIFVNAGFVDCVFSVLAVAAA